jgi:predicted transglutaminase-like cysteine proteinase
MFPRLAATGLSLLISLPLLGVGCATAPPPPEDPGFDFFAQSMAEDDPWHGKVSEWQERAQLIESRDGRLDLPVELPGPELASKSGELSIKMAGFALAQKRAVARRINIWSQVQSHEFYQVEDDEDPKGDHWPTFEELLDNNGDDCDGLDLIPYQLLLEFGFPREQVYRAIVRRDVNRKNHMVTLWFEDPKDPWVLDATGAMVLEMTRFSDVDGWTPTKMFNETQQYKVVQRRASESFALVRD